jgi:hypothetical protein
MITLNAQEDEMITEVKTKTIAGAMNKFRKNKLTEL